MARESGMASSSLRSEREQIVRERDMAIIRKVAPALPLPGSGGPPAVVDQISAPSIGG
jgi:hypothetical protein